MSMNIDRPSAPSLSTGRRITSRAVSIALCACLLQPAAVSAADRQANHPEPGLQGQTMPQDNPGSILAQPYSKGVDVVGHSPVWGRDSNVQMAWVGSCAYLASSPPNFLGWGVKTGANEFGVAVIDVSDPRAPKQVKVLQDKGAMYAAETMSAADAPGRKVLVAGAYSNGAGAGGKPNDPAWLDIYDVSDCKNPKLMSETKWPENAHTVTVSPDGKRVYGTHIEPFTGKGGIDVLDISDMANPKYVGKFGATRPDGTSFEFATHELSISPDERRIYAGVISSSGNDLNKGIKLMPPNKNGLGPGAGGIYILDNSDIVDGKADPKMRLIGTAEHGGWHSVMRANIGGVPHLVGGGELLACPGSWPRIVNIADETKPFIDGEIRLAMNKPENCPAPTAGEKATGGVVPSIGTATIHFNDVDSATKTRLGLINYMWAGLRIFDIRKPADPTEIAYFKPGDACGGHVRYMPATGDIWESCAGSGFWVLRLKPEVRKALAARR